MFYLEDFAVGHVETFGGYTMTEEEIVDFARRFDPQPFHVDREAAAASPYGGIIASGWHTASATMRMMCDAFILESASLGSPGLDELRWLKPVRPGDRLRVRTTVREVTPSRSRPSMGVVRSDVEVLNQADEVVMSFKSIGMMRRRDEAGAP